MKKLLYIVLILLCIGIPTVKADNTTTYEKMQCGDTVIPYLAAETVRTVIVILQVATPIIIIIFGMLDLVKPVIAQKEDEIKKGQKTFFKRLMVGASVFLVFVLVEFVIGLIAPKNANPDMWNCVDCFVNGDCDSVRLNN